MIKLILKLYFDYSFCRDFVPLPLNRVVFCWFEDSLSIQRASNDSSDSVGMIFRSSLHV